MLEFWKKFEENVRLLPDKVALVDGTGRCVTYREFDEMTGKTAGWLASQGIGREDFVLIHTGRCNAGIIAMYGALKAGAAFIVCEKGCIAEHIRAVKTALNCRVVIDADNGMDDIMRFRPVSRRRNDPHDAGFAIFTSGSTGRAKCVIQECGAIDMMIEAEHNAESIVKRHHRVASISPMYSISMLILLNLSLYQGATYFTVPQGIHEDPNRLIGYFEDNAISLTFIMPHFARSIRSWNTSMDSLFFGAEPTDGMYADVPHVYAVYGSSELARIGGLYPLHSSEFPTPIGHSPSRFRLFLDEKGEICADQPFFRGYAGMPEKTAEIYRNGILHTGDMGRLREDGEIILTGRQDDMFKINGNRIEPAEIIIETAELLHLTQTCAKVWRRTDGSAFIALYYADDATVSADSARAVLSARLPEIMIPLYFVRLQKMPLLPSGKIDKAALKNPEDS